MANVEQPSLFPEPNPIIDVPAHEWAEHVAKGAREYGLNPKSSEAATDQGWWSQPDDIDTSRHPSSPDFKPADILAPVRDQLAAKKATSPKPSDRLGEVIDLQKKRYSKKTD